jgi:hypothetical protein
MMTHIVPLSKVTITAFKRKKPVFEDAKLATERERAKGQRENRNNLRAQTS